MTYLFGDCELDTDLFELRRNGQRVPVEPQVFDVLLYLVRSRNRVVSKDELLAKIWTDRFVSDAALSSRIKAARRSVGDDGRAQRLIRTHHGRGFRFVGDVEEFGPNVPLDAHPLSSPTSPAGHLTETVVARLPPTAPQIVKPASELRGRSNELEQLDRLFRRAAAGDRQMVFITGEAGMGKSAIVDAFLRSVAASETALVARGQCIESRGAVEAYLPILDALDAVSSGSSAKKVVPILEQCAPTWLSQLPRLVEVDAFAALQHRSEGATRERMLREIAVALETLADPYPLVLVLEDLHWSDSATLDVLAWLGRRSSPARLLVIGTYRPSDVRQTGHMLAAVQHELRIRGDCVELALPPLDLEAVHTVVTRRLHSADLADEISGIVHSRSEGSPLFVHLLIDDWLQQRLIVLKEGRFVLESDTERLQEGIPESLMLLIEHQIRRLPADEVALLEAASVAGSRFEAATVAAVMGISVEVAEESFALIDRRHAVIEQREAVEWPDGTLTASFEFGHSLYQQVLYTRLPPSKRARLHAAVGRRLEAAYASRLLDRAAELSLQFVRARDAERAVRYLCLSAEQAIQRCAHREAIQQLRSALSWLERLPDAVDRTLQEAVIQANLGSALIATDGWSDEEAEQALKRACDLQAELADPVLGASVRCRLAALYEFRGDYAATEALLTGHSPTGRLSIASNELLACSSFHQGKLRQAVDYVQNGLDAYDADRDRTMQAALGEEPAVSLHDWAGLALWFLGYPERSTRHILKALEIAGEPDRTFSLAHAHMQAAMLCQLKSDTTALRHHAMTTIALAESYGFAYRTAVGKMLLGWGSCRSGEVDTGLEAIREGLAEHRATGAEMDRPYYLALLADGLFMGEQREECRAVLHEALAMLGSDRPFFYEPEIHRMIGVLHGASGRPDASESAEDAFLHAISVARSQEARMLELRAASDLAHLYVRGGRRKEAIDLLVPLLEWFTEGHETADLVTARTIVNQAKDQV